MKKVLTVIFAILIGIVFMSPAFAQEKAKPAAPAPEKAAPAPEKAAPEKKEAKKPAKKAPKAKKEKA
ncbi:MAG TPA: hypothetical protein PLW88_02490, partial [Syntrophorhabdaceae bacterium]|nr:hypothetical protein [Syntrophorhabdaceae bacterium]